MTPFPHHYAVSAAGTVGGAIVTTAAGLEPLNVDSPAEFDGPGDRWSPESLLAASLANCLILTFRSVARASKMSWTHIECDLIGTLDRVERSAQFTHFEIRARLEVPDDVDTELALKLLEKAHRNCLISNSLKATFDFRPVVRSTCAVPAV